MRRNAPPNDEARHSARPSQRAPPNQILPDLPPSCESASSYESASQLRVFTYLWRAVCAAPLRFLLIALVRTALGRHLARRVGGDDVGDAGGELACGR